MALRGIQVLELAGLAPAPFCGMILADFGARVIRVDKASSTIDRLGRGKESIGLNLKHEQGKHIFQQLCKKSDVLIEPFRSGVMERLGLGPNVLLADNPALVYARMTGFGQRGSLAKKAGHDINYLSISGVLSFLGRKSGPPHPPVNLLADFAGGGMTCALGIMMALFERSKSGKGQVIDANMVEGSAYIANWFWSGKDLPIWGKERGANILDGGVAYYDTYRTADDKYISIGALEPQFFQEVLKGLGIDSSDVSQFDDAEEMRKEFQRIFLSKTRDEWTEVFKDLDACYSPILDMNEAVAHPHSKENESFLLDGAGNHEPAPAPKLSRTPATKTLLPSPAAGQHTDRILQEIGYNQTQIQELQGSGAIIKNSFSKL
ncbi:hypothetical protein ScPMuIL_018854 [Solemya velum]